MIYVNAKKKRMELDFSTKKGQVLCDLVLEVLYLYATTTEEGRSNVRQVSEMIKDHDRLVSCTLEDS